MGGKFSEVEFITIFLFPKTSRPVLGPTLLFNWYWGNSLGVKQPRHEAHHPPLSCAKVNNECSHTCTPTPCLNGMHRENCTFTFTAVYCNKFSLYTKQSGTESI